MEKKPSDFELTTSELRELEKKLADISEDLKRDYFNLLVANRSKLSLLDEDRYGLLQEEVSKTWSAALKAATVTKWILLACVSLSKNLYLSNALEDVEDFDDSIESKKEIVSELNEMLRLHGGAIWAEEDGNKSPKILVVVTSRDGKGRYALEDRATKKRSGSFKSIRDMLPLIFTDDLPREGPKKPTTHHLSEPMELPKPKRKKKASDE